MVGDRKWDARMLELARVIAAWSKDPSSQVGAVITDERHRIVGMGYNGYPRGIEDTVTSRDDKLLRTIHAENNAILNATRDLEGCTIYVTHHPCARCAALIVQVGIKRVVCPTPDPDFAARWVHDLLAAQDMFHQAGVYFEEWY